MSTSFSTHLTIILQIRPLASTDYRRGHLSVLAELTVVTDPGEAPWVDQFNAQKAAPGTYYTLVVLERATDRIVGVGCVFVERKFLRGLGKVGHIEDIAVDKTVQGKKIGLRVIDALTRISEDVGCYKTILNCSDKNIGELAFLWRVCGVVPCGTDADCCFVRARLLPEMRLRKERK